MKEWERQLAKIAGDFFSNVINMALGQINMDDVKVSGGATYVNISFKHKNLPYIVKIDDGLRAHIILGDTDPLTSAIIQSKLFQQELEDKFKGGLTIYKLDFEIEADAEIWVTRLWDIIRTTTDTIYKYAERIGKALTGNPQLIDAFMVSNELD